jgi:autotransporter-associated beta strand protein
MPRTRQCWKRRSLHIEILEDRAVPAVTPAPLFFDPSAGQLALHAPAGTHTVRETLTANGFVDVALDGRLYSSDPALVWFDPALAGVRRSTLSDIRFDGSSQDTLILGSQALAGSLRVEVSGGSVTTDDVTVAGSLTIDAPSITVAGTLRGPAIALRSPGWVRVEAGGSLSAGGRVDVSAGVFVNSGQVHADGAGGGQMSINAAKVLNAGALTATGRIGGGGTVAITFTDTYIATASAVAAADGGWAGAGGRVTLSGGATGRLYSSGRQQATGGTVGGTVALLGREVVLAGAVVDASGASGGGRVFVGALQRGVAPGVNAQSVTVTAATSLRADARSRGDGGRVLVWADQTTEFAGPVSARGGAVAGGGGLVEVSAGGTLTYGSAADTEAAAGSAGTLLLDPKNLVISAAPAGVLPQFNFIDPHPTIGGDFGATIKVLSSGNIVVTSPGDNLGGSNAGAVYLFDGLTGVLISALVGSSANDGVGAVGDLIILANGNYVVASPHWNGDRGAVTWGSDTAGVSGAISAANSLVGSDPGDQVGDNGFGGIGVTALSNGNYVVASPDWGSHGVSNAGLGAVTWGSGTAGVSGTISAANSLVGSNPGDRVGTNVFITAGVIALRNGNYVVASRYWNLSRGAATWGDGTTGVRGTISAANSLIGANPGDSVAETGVYTPGVIALSNGNYVVVSPDWNGGSSNGLGAVTWGNGTAGIMGVVSAANSLIGANPGDHVGFLNGTTPGVARLRNGNYVVVSPDWNNNRGAVAWGSGTTGVSGTVSAANSLVGANPGDQVGYSHGFGISSVLPLSNGNYVVASPDWNGGRGAATWGSGTTGVSGTLSAVNSLVGSDPGDGVGSNFGGVIALANGNYVVPSSSWNSGRGAVTWGSGTAGISGTVSAANSLVGTNPGDDVGLSVTVLANGNYVVASPSWNGGEFNGYGAMTWGSGTAGVTGTVSAANSLIGANAGDILGSGGVTALANGNYVVDSPGWNGGRGAATWASGTSGQTLDGSRTITPQNSLVGLTAIGIGNLVTIVDDPLHQAFVVAFPRDGTGRGTSAFVDPNLLTYSRGQAQTVTITPDLLTRTLNTGTAVVLQASNDITINSPITVGARGHGGALTLEAGRSVLINASINTDNGPLTLIANDRLADGVVGGQRDPGNAVITMAARTALNSGTAMLTIDLRNGAGKTNRASGAITLQTVTAGTVRVTNHGPSPGSNVIVGPVTSSGPQTYTNPHGTTTTHGALVARGISGMITFFDSVRLSAGGAIAAAVVDFAGGHMQTLQSEIAILGSLVHTGHGTLRLLGTDLRVFGFLLNNAGTFDANGQAVTVGALTTIANGTTYLGSTGTQTFGSGLSLPAGGSIDGSDLILGGNVSAGADSQGNPATISGNLSLGGADRTFSVAAGRGTAQLVASAVINDSQGAGLTKDGPGTLRLLADTTYIGLTTVRNGRLVIDGNQGGSSVSLQGGILAGVGAVGDLTARGSLLSPGDPEAPGILTSQGDVRLDSATTFSVRLNGPNAGTNYDQLSLARAVDLASDGGAGSTLTVSVGFASQVGDMFTIVTTGAGVSNTFQGLPEGATFLVGDMLFQITYQGNGGTDVVLTHIAGPGPRGGPLFTRPGHDPEGPDGGPADIGTVGEHFRASVVSTLPVGATFWIDAAGQDVEVRPPQASRDHAGVRPCWEEPDLNLDELFWLCGEGRYRGSGR